MRNLFVLAMSFFSSTAVLAFNFTDCQVQEIVVLGTQNAHVGLTCNVSNRPACAAAAPYVAFDKSTTEGKQYLAMFISAQAMGAKVTGTIGNSCPSWQNNVAWLTHLRVKR